MPGSKDRPQPLFQNITSVGQNFQLFRGHWKKSLVTIIPASMGVSIFMGVPPSHHPANDGIFTFKLLNHPANYWQIGVPPGRAGHPHMELVLWVMEVSWNWGPKSSIFLPASAWKTTPSVTCKAKENWRRSEALDVRTSDAKDRDGDKNEKSPELRDTYTYTCMYIYIYIHR